MRIVAYTAVQGVYVFVFIGVLRTIFDIAVTELQKKMEVTPPKTNECPPKRGHFKRRGSSSNHLSFTPLKSNMEHNHGGLEDRPGCRGHVSFRGSGSSPGSLTEKGITQQSSQTKVSRLFTSLAIKNMAFHWQICRFFHPPCCALARSLFGFVGDCFSTQVTYYSEMPKYHDRVPKTSETVD